MAAEEFDTAEESPKLEDVRELLERFVTPIYLSLLHANFVRKPPVWAHAAGLHHRDQSASWTQIAEMVSAISDGQIQQLLSLREWRSRSVAGWCIGLSRRTAFVGQIAELLLAS